ncbi:hypothetical protein BH10PSE13_BH10PSE13_00310 [soil metagenome]
MPDMNDEDQLSKRVAKRDSLMLVTDLFNEGGQQIGRARVRNLSAPGLMAECDTLLGEGDRIELALRGVGQIAATISWVRGGRIGVAFDRTIDPKLVRRPIASAAPGTSAPAPTGYTPTRFSRPLR